MFIRERNDTCFITDNRTGSFMTKNIRTGLSGRIMRIFMHTASDAWGIGRQPRTLPRRLSFDSWEAWSVIGNTER